MHCYKLNKWDNKNKNYTKMMKFSKNKSGLFIKKEKNRLKVGQALQEKIWLNKIFSKSHLSTSLKEPIERKFSREKNWSLKMLKEKEIYLLKKKEKPRF